MGESRSTTPVPKLAVGGFGPLVVLVAAAGAVLLAARADGVSYWGTSLTLALGLPVAVVVTSALAWWTVRRADRVLGGWMLVTAASLLLYLLAVAVVTQAVAVGGRTGPVLDWIAVEALGGFAAPLVLLQVSLLVARDRFAGPGDRRYATVTALLFLLIANLVLGAAALDPDPPLDGLHAPLGDNTWLRAVADGWVAGALYLAWLLSVLVGPVALWRAVGRSSGMARRRLSVAAVVSLLPVSVIACCVVLLPVLAVADLPDRLAVEVIFAFFCVAVPATVAGLVVAASGQEEGLRLSARGLEVAIGTAVGVLAALIAVAASTVVAVTLSDSVPLVVVATVGIVSILVPVRRAVVRRLVRRADPRLATAATLVREAEEAGADRPGMSARDVLRAALGDPEVDVAVRLPDGRSWASVDGTPAAPPDQAEEDHMTRVGDAEGRPRAYVRHGTTSADAAGVVGVVGPLLERAVLEAAVRDQSERLAAERSRADRAAEDERRRLERDLHDGVQGRLLAVALDLQSADAATQDGEAHLVLTDAVASLRTAIEEMRRLATGSAPETLSKHGLRAALDDLVRRMPVPVSVRAPVERLDPATETVAYLVVSEALTNVVKHAGPCSVDVEVALRDGTLGIVVGDDGSGGVDLRAGTGLRGLTERVTAAGGTLVVSERPPRGTLLEVALPCGR